MVRLKKQKDREAEKNEDDFIDGDYTHKAFVGFHPHCYVQQLALAEAKQFDEVYALAHAPAQGDEESDA